MAVFLNFYKKYEDYIYIYNIYISTLAYINTKYFLFFIDFSYIQIQKRVYTRATDLKKKLFNWYFDTHNLPSV